MAVIAVLLGQSAGAEEPRPRELLMVGGEPVQATLAELGGKSLEFQADGEAKTVPLDELVRWGSLAERAPQPAALLADGSLIVCGPPWTRGGAVQLADGRWLLRSAPLGEVALDKSDVQAVWFPAVDGAVGRRSRDESARHAGDQERVWLASGDVLSGDLSRIGNKTLTLTTAGEEIEIELTRVAAVATARQEDSGNDAARRSTGRLQIGLDDGSLLQAARVERLANRTALRLGVGEELATKPDLGVTFLQASGDRVAYLTNLTPLDYQHTPYLSASWPLRRDAGGPGEAFLVAGRRYLNALAMHSASRVVYRVAPEWRRFAAELAVEDGRADGSVTFHVLVAREDGFEPEYDSPIIRSGDRPTPIAIDLAGARAIALLVDYADYADRGDHAVWLDARLEK